MDGCTTPKNYVKQNIEKTPNYTRTKKKGNQEWFCNTRTKKHPIHSIQVKPLLAAALYLFIVYLFNRISINLLAGYNSASAKEDDSVSQ